MTGRFIRRDRQRSREQAARIKSRHFGRVVRSPRPANATHRYALASKALVGIVGTKRQPILRTGGEHPIRFSDATGDEIVDHDTEVAVCPVEHYRVGRAG